MNNEAIMRNLETQVGQITKKLVERQSGQFSVNTQTNPKEHCNSITTRSGILVGEGICDNLVVEEVRKNEIEEENNKSGGKKKKKKKRVKTNREVFL